MHPQNASKKFRILIDDDKRLDDVIQQIFQSLNLNFGLDVDIFFLMPLPPTYAAKDTTAKRYNCDRYFYTHTHTYMNIHLFRRERRNRESGSNYFDSIEVCATQGGVAGVGNRGRCAKGGVTSFCGF